MNTIMMAILKTTGKGEIKRLRMKTQVRKESSCLNDSSSSRVSVNFGPV